ncbi:uncharacterized protein LOC135113410 [Scylla paramamosain]|uniref:uncharacterized protein LOC135113410 n=1 Tax=Scylla paramamosain TaxID=85552 RepID=UPI0030839A9B
MTSRGLGYIKGDLHGSGHKRFDQRSVKTRSFTSPTASMNTQEWMCLRLVVMLAVVMVASPTSAVPKRVANRMVPSWWSRVRNVCWSASDCSADECCARPMLSSKAYCMPLRARGQVCDASPLMLNINNGVYFSDCPCQYEPDLRLSGHQSQATMC